MLSEIQVKRLLAEIENATRRPLTQLRTSLLRSTDPNATLWELVVLYVCSRFFEDVEHEPHPGIADVLAHDVRVGFEAFVVRSVQQREAVKLRRYYSWVISEVLSSANRKHAYDANIQPSRSKGSVSIPNQQDWKKAKASAEWPRFVEDVREHAKAVFVDSLSNLVIALQLRNSGGGSVNSYLPQVPEVIEDHPVYRAIRKKARQIKKWDTEYPIVLVVGTYEVSSEFDEDATAPLGLQRAIWSAFLDPTDLDPAQAYNLLGRGFIARSGTWVMDTRTRRVPGSERIAGVLFVNLSHPLDPYKPAFKEARGSYYPNPRSSYPLSKEQEERILAMDFGVVEFGPGWEAWDDTARGTLLERNLRRGDSMTLSFGADESFSLEVPAIYLVQVLSGLKNVESGESTLHPTGHLRRALQEGRELRSIVLKPAETQRGEDRVILEFTPPLSSAFHRSKA